MGKTVEVNYEDGLKELNVDSFPDSCPLCHHGIDPRFFRGYFASGRLNLELLFQCPRADCLHLFIGYYYGQHFGGIKRDVYILGRLAPNYYEPQELGVTINSVSKDFVQIYNQSEQAEKLDLSEIAGPGYRKSLEFLIKDFVISKITDKKEEIKRLPLGDVIANYVDDSRIQTTAKRAAWLGNDETHYYRKWENKDISDLKKLIGLTVRWIESVKLTEEYENTMPSGKN